MFSANPSNGWLVVMKAIRHLFEGSKLRGMDLGPNLRALIRILRPFNWHLVCGDEAAVSECSGESALLVCSFVPLAIPHPVSSAGVLAPSSLALPVPETKQKPLSLDTGSPPQARTALAFPGGPVCSLMASAKAPPNPTPGSNRCALRVLTLLWVQPGPLISPLGQSIVHTQTASADTVILPFVFLLHAVAFKCQIVIRSLPL